MKKVLFLIHDLWGGGAEKVLVNLVNNMDYSKFDVTVMCIFDVGENKMFLRPEVHYKYVYKNVFKGNQHFMKLLSPESLHKKYIKDVYDVEIAFLEGPCARIISGCQNKDTKLVSWIHCTMKSKEQVSGAFRSYSEAAECYKRFDKMAFVSKDTQNCFVRYCNVNSNMCVLYNTNETEQILREAKEPVNEIKDDGSFKLVGTGKLEKLKGFDRLIRIQKKLLDDGYKTQTYILGKGSEEDNLRKLAEDLGITDSVQLLGYQSNPHKYVAKCDLFVCTSFSEGFSTAATEALIVGTPVCTVEVSGMKEMLGKNNEYGVVTKNDEDALYEQIKKLLDDTDLYTRCKRMAEIRGKDFSTEKTVLKVEKMLGEL